MSCQRCAELAARIQEYEELLLGYRKALQPKGDWRAPREIGLTPLQQRVLGVLVARHEATTDALMLAAYGASAYDVSISTLHVHLSALRRKLRRFGITIKTTHLGGWYGARETMYCISPADRERLQNWGPDQFAKVDDSEDA